MSCNPLTAGRLLHLVLFSAMQFRAEASYCVICVTFSIHDLRGPPSILTPSNEPCRIVFARGVVSRDVAEPVHLAPLDDAEQRFLLAYEFINLSFDIFVYFREGNYSLGVVGSWDWT